MGYPPNRRPGPRGQYEDFAASELWCGRCRRAVPVRKRLLLVLPDGEKYDYACTQCGTSVGSQVDVDPERGRIIGI